MRKHRCFDYLTYDKKGERVCELCGKSIKWNPKNKTFDSLFRAISIGLTKSGGCDNKLTQTEKFCNKNQIDIEQIIEDLRQGCDCEILMNVRDGYHVRRGDTI